MSAIDFDKVWFKKLSLTDDLTGFNCNEEDDSGCNDFIRNENEAKQYQKERHGITYLFFYEETMIGYITLAMSSISALRLDAGLEENVRLKFYPCVFIGRLAVDNNWRHMDVGTYLANWATGFALEMSENIGCRYIVLEAKESKVDFYSSIGFQKGFALFTDDLVWLYKKIATDE
jgi:predicted GNAT family N-acyltransferase